MLLSAFDSLRERIFTMTNSELLIQIKIAVQEERKITLKVLRLLKEVESRRLYAERGYSSLFNFAVGYLGYSEPAAHRRVLAMEALRDIPRIEERIISGNLTLTNISQAQGFIRREIKNHKPVTQSEKIDLF